MNSNIKKEKQLGIPFGTANHQLRKSLMFQYVKLAGFNYCYQCNLEIENIEDFSIEHKIPWLDSENPISLFFDLNNIAFSHLKCNVGAKRILKSNHGTANKYNQGCRCNLCKKANTDKVIKYRNKKKLL